MSPRPGNSPAMQAAAPRARSVRSMAIPLTSALIAARIRWRLAAIRVGKPNNNAWRIRWGSIAAVSSAAEIISSSSSINGSQASNQAARSSLTSTLPPSRGNLMVAAGESKNVVIARSHATCSAAASGSEWSGSKPC